MMVQPPRRILMTLDAAGGVWQYAMALAGELRRAGSALMFAGVGPRPTPAQMAEAQAIGSLVWLQSPPDWLAADEQALLPLADEIAALVREHDMDLVHLNAPTQAAALDVPCPVVAVSHSCVVTWFHVVRGSVPEDETWAWHMPRNSMGFARADMIVSPSEAHASALEACYGALPHLRVVHNAVAPATGKTKRENIIAAAGRWWDDGKNGKVLDEAAARSIWPVFAAGPTQTTGNGGMAFRHATSLGPIRHDEARELMAQAGIFVSPSLYEPFGLAALEAAHAGTPLVLADIPTYRELWDGAAAFFPPQAVSALAQILNQLARDSDRRTAMGNAARDRAQDFTLARQAAAMQAIYHEASLLHAKRI